MENDGRKGCKAVVIESECCKEFESQHRERQRTQLVVAEIEKFESFK